MKLFSVTASWHPYKAKKDLRQTSVIMAESREEAIEKFNGAVSYPKGARIDVMEWESGIYTMSIRKAI